MKSGNLAAGAAILAIIAAMGGPALAQPSDGVRIVLPSEPTDLDPCNNSLSAVGNVIRQNVIETLTVLDPVTGDVKPRLATSWEDVGGGTWRIKLREGVTFHDGAPLDADAVKTAIDRMTGEKFYCVDRDRVTTDLSVAVVDAHTVDITSTPAQLLMPIFLTVFGIGSPATPADQLTRSPIGTGPYAFSNWTPEGIVLDRFAGYWGEQPAVAQASYVVRSESALRASMVEVGEADIALAISPQDATNDALDKTYPDGETTRIRMVLKAPLDDIRVRKAMNLAFDRESLVGTILSPDVVPAIQDFGPRVLGFNPDLKPWSYAPDEAKALIAEAKADGVPVDTEITVFGRLGMFSNIEDTLQVMIQNWNDVGLNIKLQMIETGQWVPMVTKPFAEDRPVALFPEMHDNNFGDASFSLPARFHADGAQAEVNIPELTAMIDTAVAATGEERRSLFQEVNRFIAEDVVPDVKMFHMVAYMRVGERLDFQPTNADAGQLELSQLKFKN